MKVARTAEYEDLFARGYPNLRRLITPHADEAAAEKHALSAANEGDPGRYHVDWPAEVAYRYVRALAQVGEFGIGFKARVEQGLVKKAAAGLATAGPVDDKEGRALIAALLGAKHNHYGFQIEHCALLLEAMIGTPAFVDAVLGEFERMKDLEGEYSSRNEVAYTLGFAIRRLPDKARKGAEARVAKLVATKPKGYTRDFLSYLIGGRKALEDSGRKLGLYCLHFCDDPALIREVAADSCSNFDASHVALAGDGLLDHLKDDLRAIDAPRLPWLIEELAQLASTKVDPILNALLAKKKYAARAQAALDLRAGKTPKPPAKAKPKPPTDASIEKRFEELSGWIAAELAKVRGKKAKETKLLDEAALRYADIRTDLEQPPMEALVHFFGADGCGWKKHRTPGLLRVTPEPTDAELARWTEHLGTK